MLDTNSNVIFSGSAITGNTVADGLPVIRQLSNLGGVMLNGWTPGEALSVLVDGNKSLTLPGVPSGNGCTFLGWAAAADYGGPTDTTNKANFLAAGAQGTPGTTYYAVWEQTYTVTYTDGVESEEVFADQVYPDLASGTQTPSFNGAPARSGYVFAGWTPALSATVTADATYTATWAEDANGDGIPDDSQKYTVTYTDGAAGAAFADEVHAGILTGSATPGYTGGTPARSGYVFTGWTPEVAATVTADATYTATWAEGRQRRRHPRRQPEIHRDLHRRRGWRRSVCRPGHRRPACRRAHPVLQRHAGARGLHVQGLVPGRERDRDRQRRVQPRSGRKRPSAPAR